MQEVDVGVDIELLIWFRHVLCFSRDLKMALDLQLSLLVSTWAVEGSREQREQRRRRPEVIPCFANESILPPRRHTVCPFSLFTERMKAAFPPGGKWAGGDKECQKAVERETMDLRRREGGRRYDGTVAPAPRGFVITFLVTCTC